MKWLLECFWPFHTKTHGNRHCILLLDNFSAHTKITDDPRIPNKLHIVFFPPNCTSFMQPADMGMIATLKIGYRMKMLDILLNVCDTIETYNKAVAVGMTLRRGCKGLYHGSKATVLDALQILKPLWDGNDKYCRVGGIKRCWRKTDILPADMHDKLLNETGGVSLQHESSNISNEDSNTSSDLVDVLG